MQCMGILEMTQREIYRKIYRGVEYDRPVGLTENLTDEEIFALPRHPAWRDFDENFKDWVWYTIDSQMEDQHV